MFDPNLVDLTVLRKRAYNLRWATVPEGVIPLTAADPDTPCAPEIAEAISRYAKDRYFCYGPPEGMVEFRESLAAYYQINRRIPASAAWIFPVDSAAYGIYLTCKAFLSPGDEAILFDPVDFLFRYSIEAADAKPVAYALPAGAAFDMRRMESLINKKTRLLCLCNPLNPTGKVFTEEELMCIGELACKYNLLILSDEIWSDIVFPPHVYTSISSLTEEVRDRTVTVTGFSKSYGLAGLRIGAVMASNRALYERLFEASLHTSTVHGVNLIAQVAATAALRECGPWLKDFLRHLQSLRDICIPRLNALPGFRCVVPEGCYVAFADISGTGKSSLEMQELLLEEARVAVVPGMPEWFGPGAAGHIRLSFATSREILTDALDRIKHTIQNL
ncbi:MAG TPA: pyridoxal phosphate-dependent aminotransferase [Puia sp.]|nr:pyridoxal phosphate-dependent aminotransferase [Puia sp.]